MDKIPENESILVISAYKVAIISGALALPLSIFSSVVIGYQQMAVINISKNIISIFSIGLSIILLKTGIGLVALPLATLFIVIMDCIISYIFAKKYFPLNGYFNILLIKLLESLPYLFIIITCKYFSSYFLYTIISYSSLHVTQLVLTKPYSDR